MNELVSMRYDTAIVLGGGLESKDTLNLRTIARLRKATELFRANLFGRIILSGGISFSAPAYICRSEASLMRDWLVAYGIPEHTMHLEEDSTDTLGNAYFSKEQLLVPNAWRSVLVITSEFHIERCRYLFQKALGTNYSVDFTGCSDNFPKDEAERINRLESHIRHFYARHWLDSVIDGDSDAVYKILFAHHPGHASNPDFTKEQFMRALYGDPAI